MTQNIKEVNVKYEKQVSSQDVIQEANSIWNELRRRNIHPDDTKSLDAFYTEMVDKHLELARAYPIVMRYMCQLGCYNEKAFKNFIKKMIDQPSRKESDYLDLQANYIKMLYIETRRSCGKKWDTKTASAIYADTRKKLQEEADKFKEMAKTYAEENARKEEKYKNMNISGFAQFLEDNREFFETDGVIPIRTNAVCDTTAEDKLRARIEEIKEEEDEIKVEEFL
jgi:hypothetical protein